MESLFAHYLSLVSLVYFTPIPLLIIFFHRTLWLWRKLGTISYYIFTAYFAVAFVICAVVAWDFRNLIWSWQLYNHWLSWMGWIPLIIGLGIGASSIQTLSIRVLLGFPEFDASHYPSKLVTQGLYRYVRHPRYLEFILEAVGVAILSGLWVSVLFLIYFIPAIYALTCIEESELVKRFGSPYVEYRKHTGRFFPKLRSI